MTSHEDRHDRRRAARPSHGDEQLAAALGAVANLNDVMQQLHAGIKTSNAVRRLGAESRPLNGVSQKISSSPGRLAGYSIRESSGTAAATVHLHDGTDADGDLIATIRLGSAASNTQWFMPAGISFSYGLFVEIVTGQIEGAVHLGTTL